MPSQSRATDLPPDSHPAERDEDDVIYLGTFPLRPCQSSTGSASRRSTVDASRTLDQNPLHNRSGERAKRTSRRSRQRASARTTQHRGAKTAHQQIIPTAMRNRNVWVGRARGSPERVFGFFDNAGRFRYRVEGERVHRATDPSPCFSFAPIAHDNIAYHPTFQHMSRRQVRAEVRRRLNEHASFPQIGEA